MNKSSATIDVEVILRSANALVDSLLPRARRIEEKISSLQRETTEEAPRFDGDFTQEGLLTHIERLEEWIRAPWRARSRKMLEAEGVKCESLSGELLDDSDGAEKTAAAVARLRNTENPVASLLKASEILTTWLREGHSATQKRLESVDRAKEGLLRLAKCQVPEELRIELLRRVVLDPDCLLEMETIGRKAEELGKRGFDLSCDSSWEQTLGNIIAVSESLGKLSALLGASATSGVEGIKDGKLGESGNALKAKIEQIETDAARLRKDWCTLSSAAEALGISSEMKSPPERITELENEVRALRENCLARLGEQGMHVLAFLREERDFPLGMSSKEIEKALVALRPMISHALRGQKFDA